MPIHSAGSQVKYEEMRPRAKVVIPFTDLDIGMDVMINFNMEEHEERGWSVEELSIRSY